MNTVKQIATAAQASNAHIASVVKGVTAPTLKSIEPYANNAAWAVISRNPMSITAPDFAEQVHAELISHFASNTGTPMSDAQLMSNMQQLDKTGPGLNGWFSHIFKTAGHAISAAYKSVKNAVVKVVHAVAKPVLIAVAIYLGQVYLLPMLGVGAAAGAGAAGVMGAGTGAASMSGFVASATGIGASTATIGALSVPAWAQAAIHLIPTAVNYFKAKAQSNSMKKAVAQQQAAQQAAAMHMQQSQGDSVAIQFLQATPQQQQAYYNALPVTGQQQLSAAIQRVVAMAPATSPIVPAPMNVSSMPVSQTTSQFTTPTAPAKSGSGGLLMALAAGMVFL